MNYLILKSIVDTTIAHFVCRNCQGNIGERDVTIVGATDQEVALSAHCPQCHEECAIKAEISLLKNGQDLQNALGRGTEHINMMNIELPNGVLSELASEVEQLKNAIVANKSAQVPQKTIKDADIVALHAKLREGSISAHDLFDHDL